MSPFRLVPVAVGMWAVVLVAVTWEWAAGTLAVGCWVAAGGVVVWVAVHRSASVLVLIPVIAAVAVTHVALAAPGREAMREAAGKTVTVEVTVTSKVEPAWAGAWRLSGSATGGVGTVPGMAEFSGPVVVLFTGHRPTDLDLGATIVVTGSAVLGRTGEEAVLAVRAARFPEVSRPPPPVFQVAAQLRGGLLAQAERTPQPGGMLLPGLSVGETSLVDDGMDADMKTTGLSHLTAVSGSNCILIVGLAYLALKWLRAGRRTRAAGALVALAAFVLLVTPEPSVMRAAVMASIATFALLAGRARLGLATLATTVTVLLAISPWLATSIGFALSVAATAALLTIARPISHTLERVFPRPVAIALAVPLSAQLACAPILVLLSPVISVWSVLANLIAGPAAPLATIAGLVACMTASIPVVGVVATAIAWVPAQWVAVTAQIFADLPGATLPWLDGVLGALALAAVCGAATALLIGVRGRAVRGAAVVVVTVVVGVFAGTWSFRTVVQPLTTPRDWNTAVCDVGQGDAVLVRDADVVALIDTGPDPAALSACLERLGVGTISLLILTHFDLDHVGGVDAVRGRVELVLHGPVPQAKEGMLDGLTESGAAVREVSAGAHGGLGNAAWQVLWPQPHAQPGNDASVVVEFRGGDMRPSVFLGDLSADGQDRLLTARTLRPPYDVVKVAHHGSGDQSARLYAKLRGTLALIPVGVDNDYGHPRSETLAMLASQGYTMVRSDVNGLILLGAARGGVSVWCERAASIAPP